MKGHCSLAACGVKDGLSCELGNPEIKCPHFSEEKEAASEASVVSSEIVSGQRLPWSGRALGMSDMTLASARSSTVLVGLIGPFKAGKTGFLTSLFAHFAKTGTVGAFSFAGSYSLQAWSQLRHYTEWPSSAGPSFPPHTPDSAERVPSLLHLAFRKGSETIRDILFTDAPGEWFTRWIKNQSSENAHGARWVVDNSTHFLFFVDRAALAGEFVGKVRQEILALARVLSEQRRGRPIFVIWSKSDLECSPEVETPVREKLRSFFGEHPSIELHVEDPRCLEVLDTLLAEIEVAPFKARLSETETESAFLAYTGNIQ